MSAVFEREHPLSAEPDITEIDGAVFNTQVRGGHTAYAEAMRKVLKGLRSPLNEEKEVIYQEVPTWLGAGYDWVLQHIPEGYGWVYNLSDHFWFLREVASRNLLHNEKALGAVMQGMEQSKQANVDFVYISHPLLRQLARKAQKELGFTVPILCSLQELTVGHRTYVDGHRDGVDGFLVTIAQAADFAIKAGIPAEDVAIVGYQPQPDFIEVAAKYGPRVNVSIIEDRRLFYRESLISALESEEENRPDLQRLRKGLNTEKALVLVTGWTDKQWRLLGKLLKKLKKNPELKDKVQVAVLCGRDEKYFGKLISEIDRQLKLNDNWLKENLFPLEQSSPKIVAHLLRAVGAGDGVLLAASAGTNFLLEALTEYVHGGVIWRAIPGQEPPNACWANENGLAVYCKGSIGRAVDHVLERLINIQNDVNNYPEGLGNVRAQIIEQARGKLIKALKKFSARGRVLKMQSS